MSSLQSHQTEERDQQSGTRQQVGATADVCDAVGGEWMHSAQHAGHNYEPNRTEQLPDYHANQRHSGRMQQHVHQVEIPRPVPGHQFVNAQTEVHQRPIVRVPAQHPGSATIPEGMCKRLKRGRLILDD